MLWNGRLEGTFLLDLQVAVDAHLLYLRFRDLIERLHASHHIFLAADVDLHFVDAWLICAESYLVSHSFLLYLLGQFFTAFLIFMRHSVKTTGILDSLFGRGWRLFIIERMIDGVFSLALGKCPLLSALHRLVMHYFKAPHSAFNSTLMLLLLGHFRNSWFKGALRVYGDFRLVLFASLQEIAVEAVEYLVLLFLGNDRMMMERARLGRGHLVQLAPC